MNSLKITGYMAIMISLVISASLYGEEADLKTEDFLIENARVEYRQDLKGYVFSKELNGIAGRSVPKKIGSIDKASVYAYVFLTTLRPTSVGFSETDGILALAVTSHPDFDDTPLWDENSDGDFNNDGYTWHTHWVVLIKDKRAKGGFSVRQIKSTEKVTLPPTNPGMPMFMDSPGFGVITNNNRIAVFVPGFRINAGKEFMWDSLSCELKVNTTNKELPILGVQQIFDIYQKDIIIRHNVTFIED